MATAPGGRSRRDFSLEEEEEVGLDIRVAVEGCVVGERSVVRGVCGCRALARL